MGRSPGSQRRTFIVFAVVLVAATAGLIWWLRPAPSHDDIASPPASDPTAAPGRSDSASATPDEQEPAEDAAGAGAVPEGADGLPALGGGELPSGLAGEGGGVKMPEVRISLEVSSSEPIGVVGYQVPTSSTDPSGTVRGVGRRWALRTTGYGRPDYARLFFAAGPSGAPVTCVIRVDGRVTERRSTEGPYGRMMCQG